MKECNEPLSAAAGETEESAPNTPPGVVRGEGCSRSPGIKSQVDNVGNAIAKTSIIFYREIATNDQITF